MALVDAEKIKEGLDSVAEAMQEMASAQYDTAKALQNIAGMLDLYECGRTAKENE
jgi:hypothetical protein